MNENVEVITIGELMNGQPTEFVTKERYEEIIRLNKKGGTNDNK